MSFDYAARMQSLQAKIRDAELDAFLVTQQESIYYLTGASYKPLERPFFILVRPEGQPDLLVPELERAHMRKAEGFHDVLSYFDYPCVMGENWFDKLNALLGDAANVGLEPGAPLEISQKIDAETVSAPFLDQLRVVKSEEEIAAIRYAARYADEGMSLLIGNLYDGVSVIELFSLGRGIQTKIIKSGEYDPLNSEFLTAAWPAPHSAQPHSVPPLQGRLSKGPLSLMSFLRVNGYAAECERTAFIGKPSDKDKELFMHMQKARETAFALVRPGTVCSDIDAATQDYFRSQGLAQYILHRTGHGIGQGNHEAPYISAGSSIVLKKNMVISIEPAIYLPDIGGFRHSDTVLVTDTGYESLTHYPDRLSRLTVSPKNTLQALKGGIIRRALNMK
jgi:Xaa-Pro aminopeptidase